jgi:5,10-methylenetetrahydromethanopterin reductase
MTPPFRIGVMQLTMEPLEEILEHARQLDRCGFDTIWLAEAYPWWRKHSMEARSSTALSAVIGRETERLTVGWGIISPYTRHPIQVAMEARVTQEATGNGRFRLGFGASKIFMREIGEGERKPARPLTAIKESIQIVRPILNGEGVDFEGREYTAHVPPLREDAAAPREPVPLYVAGTGPKMQEMAGQLADGLLTPSITTPGFVRYARENLRRGAEAAGRDPEEIDLGCTIVASIDEDREKGREGAREIAGMYLANKVQNIQASADVLLEEAGLSQDEIRPIAEAMESGGRIAAAAAVTDAILDKTRPIAGTPQDCIEAIEEYREAGCSHVMLELWGNQRDRQIELFAEKVLPQLR